MGIAGGYFALLDHLGATVPIAQLRTASPGDDVVGLRHDVDHDLDVALEMACWEHRRGVRSTYYLLHTAPYWSADERLLDKALQLQDWGHEVGLHVNVVTEWVRGEIDDVAARTEELLDRLRGAGLQVRGVAAHGDRACYEHGFANYWQWRELRPDDPAAHETGRSAEGIPVEDAPHQLAYPPDGRLTRADGAALELWSASLTTLGIEYDAAHVGFERYFTDSGGGWRRSPDPLTERVDQGRVQVLVHPEHWRDPDQRLWLVLSTARSGSRWLTGALEAAAPVRARHEFTLNHRRGEDGEAVADKRTGAGFAELAGRPEELHALMVDARVLVEEEGDDHVEANVYLAHALEQVDAVFPDARLIHLHRDPADVVRSILERDWYDTPHDDRHARIPVENWERMTQLERACWYVRHVNEALLARDLPRVALEEVTRSPRALGDALAAAGLPYYPRLAGDGFAEPVNVARSHRVAPVAEWPAADRATLARICDPVRRRLGYAVERPGLALAAGHAWDRVQAWRRRRRPEAAPVDRTLLDVRYDGAEVPPSVEGARLEPVEGGLRIVPGGDRHVHVLIGGGRWKAIGPQDGWPAASGMHYSAELDVEVSQGGAVSAYCLMYGEDGRHVASRPLGRIRPGATLRPAFTTRADAHRFVLGLYLSRDDLPETVVLRGVRLEQRRAVASPVPT